MVRTRSLIRKDAMCISLALLALLQPSLGAAASTLSSIGDRQEESLSSLIDDRLDASPSSPISDQADISKTARSKVAIASSTPAAAGGSKSVSPTVPPQPPVVRARATKIIPKSRIVPLPNMLSSTDLRANNLSNEALELAKNLKIESQLGQVIELRKKLKTYINVKPPIELRADFNDAKEECMEALEQARLEIEFVQAEFQVEIAGSGELLQAYGYESTRKANELNLRSFRLNGALWAVAEGLDIPTYKQPRYSIPSGAIGIVAGLVPSAFSYLAVKTLDTGHYDRDPRPNMLAPLLNYPETPRVEYPKSVWTYLHQAPNDYPERARIDCLFDNWIEDKNIHIFSDKTSRTQLDSISGSVQKHLTLDLLADRLNMLQQLSALISQMNRPMLELMMVIRGNKHVEASVFTDDASSK